MRRDFKYNFIVLALSICSVLPAFSQTFPTAQEIADDMTIGWNIGNTLEATGCIPAQFETCWGNPAVSQQLIDAVKASGFNTIRIPCSWNQFANQSTNQIDGNWLARVKQVVDYCYAQDLYVMLNIHWDGGWLEENCTLAAQGTVGPKQAAFWQQIADYFKDYDEHLLFASANEPHVDNTTEMSVLTSYHQIFINTVRASGGNNDQRTLIIQGPATDIEKTNNWMNTLPVDPTPDRLMVEVHFYPYQFTLMQQDEAWGNQFYYWGQCNHSTTDPAHNATDGEEALVDQLFQSMKTKFVDNGYPIILGEYGARLRTNLSGANFDLHKRSREYFLKYVTRSAINHGMVPVYWCAGLGDLYNRNNNTVAEPGTLNALMAGAYTNSTTVNCGNNDCQGTQYGHAYTNACNNCVLGYDASCGSAPDDCNGVSGGTATIDDCGVCSGGNTNITPNSTCTQDCNGVWDGDATIDDCGYCTGGNTGNTPCDVSLANGVYTIKSTNSDLCLTPGTPVTQETCTNTTNQIWQVTRSNGKYTFVNLNTGEYLTYSGTTAGDGINTSGSSANSQFTLESDGNGSFLMVTSNTDVVMDISGGSTNPGINALIWTRTGGTNQLFYFEEVTDVDCNGDIAGSATIDNCGVCSGGNTTITPNSTCVQDCNGEWDGTASVDDCGVCSGGSTNITPNSSCVQDCNGEWDGTASVDNCGVCSGGSTNITPNSTCVQDCNNEWGGSAEVDNCGVCSGGSTGLVPDASCTDCNGDLNGTATIDGCGVCSGGNTGVEACSIVEAELACDYLGTIDNNWTGFTGTGFVNTTNVLGANVVLSISSPTAQNNATLTFKYANGGGTARPAELTVNGINAVTTVNFASTGGWDTWQTEAVVIDLIQGVNVIEMIATTASGIANVDHVFANVSISLGSCATDCNGDIGGSATTDACGKCIGGNTNAESDDADNDGVIDCEDGCPNDADKTAPGICGCGIIDSDVDGDGIADCNDNFPFDFDNDGVATADDCDDTNPSIGTATVWYEDADNDGLGDANATTTSCDQPTGYVATTGDECPNDGNKTTPGTCGCGTADTDSDNDGVEDCNDQCPNDPAKTAPGICGCGVVDVDVDNDGQCDNTDDDLDNDGVPNDTDCEPTNPNVGAATTWYADNDGDGLGAAGNTTVSCTQPLGYVDNDTDANDNDFDNDGVITNIDCDDQNDAIGAATTWYADFDNDGQGDPNSTSTSCTQPNGYVANSGDQCPTDPNKTNPGNCGCGASEQSCLDCAGTPNGSAFYDNCGLCITTINDACTQDCFGDWGGTAEFDACNDCAGGNTGIAPVTDPTLCIATSIEQYEAQFKLVYPNPTTGALNLSDVYDWQLMDMTGNRLKTGRSNHLTIQEYDPGVYFIRIQDQVIKVIKE